MAIQQINGRAFSAILVAASILCPALANPAHTGSGSNELTIIIKSEHPISPATLRQMETEFGDIMSPVARTSWRIANNLSGGEAFQEAIVATFKGACTVDESWSPGWVRGKLAQAYTIRDQVQPFAEIDCDAVRMLLTSEMPSRNLSALQSMLGRALARVLAHEAYHILRNTPAHSRHGIAKAEFSATDLFGGVLRFEARDIYVLRARFTPTPNLLSQNFPAAR